jgi:hypothetical protein
VRRAAAALVAVAALVGGCGGGSGTQTAPVGPPKVGATAADEAVVRGWTEALYAGRVDRAADFFAPGAIVQQVQTLVLTDHRAAVAFNRSLPCRAKVTAITREKGGLLLASFRLYPGLGGTCADGGTARVRFHIRAGHIEVWRQLPDAPAPPGQSV